MGVECCKNNLLKPICFKNTIYNKSSKKKNPNFSKKLYPVSENSRPVGSRKIPKGNGRKMELSQSISSLEMKIRPQDALYKVRSLLQQAYSPQKDEKFFKI